MRVPISFNVSLPKASMSADFNTAIASLGAIPKAGAAASNVALEMVPNIAPGFTFDVVPVAPVKTTLTVRLMKKNRERSISP